MSRGNLFCHIVRQNRRNLVKSELAYLPVVVRRILILIATDGGNGLGIFHFEFSQI